MLLFLLLLNVFADHWAFNNKQTFLTNCQNSTKRKNSVRSQSKKNPFFNPIYKSMENKCTLPPFFYQFRKNRKVADDGQFSYIGCQREMERPIDLFFLCWLPHYAFCVWEHKLDNHSRLEIA